VKFFFAGAENKTHAPILLKLKMPYLLMSYYNIRNKKDIVEYLGKFKKYGAEIMLDSGAHTLQKGKNKINYEGFVNGYIKFLRKYGEFFTAFVELDIDNIVGLAKVEEWTKKITEKVGRQPIVVWHKERGWEYWKKMCREYDYVGFSGFVSGTGQGEVPHKFVPLFLKEAKKHNTKVHGFGYTKPALVKRFHFYSVDSSSWLIGCRWGGVCVFTNNKLTMYSKQNFFKKYKKYNNLNSLDINYFNAQNWLKYAEYINQYWQTIEGGNKNGDKNTNN